MAERKSQNKYYPPSWDPSKGSINKFVGQHSLRHRARKLDQGILIVRFELPFNMWCLHCNGHVGMGVRYNAEKKKIGNYFTTDILSFRFKCHLCNGWIEIHTDPKNTEYVIVSGAKKKSEDWDPNENETIDLKDDKDKSKLETNPFYKLETSLEDEIGAGGGKIGLTRLQEWKDRTWKDPYTLSTTIRKKFRTEKKANAVIQADSDRIMDKISLPFKLLPPSLTDDHFSKQVKFDQNSEKVFEIRKDDYLSSSIFNNSKNTSSSLQQPSLSNLIKGRASLIKARQTGLGSDPFQISSSLVNSMDGCIPNGVGIVLKGAVKVVEAVKESEVFEKSLIVCEYDSE